MTLTVSALSCFCLNWLDWISRSNWIVEFVHIQKVQNFQNIQNINLISHKPLAISH